MTMAAKDAQRDEIARAASPAADFRGRFLTGASVVCSISEEIFSGIAMGSRVLTGQASLRIWTML
jgi:hypothetical protein